MPSAESDSIQAKASRYFPLWNRGELPKAPEFGWRRHAVPGFQGYGISRASVMNLTASTS